MDGITHFQLPYNDQSRAQKFYEDIFGWKIFPVPDVNYYWIHTTETDDAEMPVKPGIISGGMYQRKAPEDVVMVMVTVDSIDDHLEKIEAAGGSVALPKTAVANYGFLAQIIDTEGNRIGLWQNAEH